MTEPFAIERLPTGVRNLDEILGGGIPKNSLVTVVGPPGSGKTILAQQICFHNARPEGRVLAFNTLSEPTAKTLRNLKKFEFFDESKLRDSIEFVDIGTIMRADGLDRALEIVMAQIERVAPAIVVVDSFKVFDDLARSREDLRIFGYQLAVNLMAWECSSFLLGEYAESEFETNPLFSIVDGIFFLTHRLVSGEDQRFCRVVKMRGTDHSRDESAFVINDRGIEVFAPRTTIRRTPSAEEGRGPPARLTTGLRNLDLLLGEGIPEGSSLLVSGSAGTGKTVLLLEFVYRGALRGERGLLVSFEETRERLLATGRGLGWELDREIDRGMVEILFIPQPDIAVEADLLRIRERVESIQARRVAIDSISVFLHKVRDPEVVREKVFQLASIVQNASAVGLFATDVPYGSRTISRFGVEETVVDGVILISSTEEGRERHRYIEVYKLRNTSHLMGRHAFSIGEGGASIFPRYGLEHVESAPAVVVEAVRLPSGIPGLDDRLGGGFLERSSTLVSGSAGIGKTTFGLQFLLEGARHGDPGLFITVEEGPQQILASASALDLPLGDEVEAGRIAIVYLPRSLLRARQHLEFLTERIEALGARRVVLDGAGRLAAGSLPGESSGESLQALTVRFKTLRTTSVLTLEAPAGAAEYEAGHGLSPLADNLILLRYASREGRIVRTLRVLKSRASAHELEEAIFRLGQGGISLLEDGT